MFTVYVLYSQKYHKIYIGYTWDLEQRLLSHNKLGTKGWTINYRPWEVLHTEEFATKQEAMQRERQLKSGGGRRYFTLRQDKRCCPLSVFLLKYKW